MKFSISSCRKQILLNTVLTSRKNSTRDYVVMELYILYCYCMFHFKSTNMTLRTYQLEHKKEIFEQLALDKDSGKTVSSVAAVSLCIHCIHKQLLK